MKNKIASALSGLLVVLSLSSNAITYVPVRVGDITVILPIDDPPVAVDDTVSANEDVSLTIDVLANDTDEDVANVSIAILEQMDKQGATSTITLSNNQITYLAPPDWNGNDWFRYQLTDIEGNTSLSATVNVTVNPVNDAPIPLPDTATITEAQGHVYIDVLANDYDVDGDNLVVTNQAVFDSRLGVTDGGDNQIRVFARNATFDPSEGIQVEYWVSDGTETVWTRDVTVYVNDINNVPHANAVSKTIQEDQTVTISMAELGSDPDGDALIVTATSGQGSVEIANTSIRFTPNTDFVGVATISYSLSDGRASAYETITLTITPVNDAPVAVSDTATLTEGGQVTIPVLQNDIDVDGDPLTVLANTLITSGGTATVIDNAIVFTPSENFHGTGSVQYSISDDAGLTSTATASINVTPVNDAPVAVNDSASTNEDAAVLVNVLANDYDVDGDTLTVASAELVTPAQGNIVVQADNQVQYTPATNFNGTALISYSVSDGNGASTQASLSVVVIPVNDAPIAVDDSATLAEDGQVTVPVLQNDSDVDGDPLTILANPLITQGGTATVTNNTIVFTASDNFHGTGSVQYSISDDSGLTSTATASINVTPVNDAPVATDDSGSTNEDSAITLSVLNNDYDPDGDTLNVTSATSADGTVSITAANEILFTPTSNFNGTATINYTLSDGLLNETAVVTVNVIAVNDPPVISGAPSTSVFAGQSYSFTPSASDVDTGSLEFSITGKPGWATFSSTSGQLAGTAAIGTYNSIVISVSDGVEIVSLPAFNISVAAGNEAPEITGSPNTTVQEGDSYSFTPIASDANNDDLTFSIQNKPEWSTFDASTGALSGTPTQSHVGNYTGITISVTDGVESASLPAFSITVTPMDTPAWAESGGSAQAAAPATPTVDESTFNGATPGQAGVSGGGANYNVPIVIPPGRNGMQPSVSLNYSSRSGLGIAGVGWSLSAGSSISRCPKTVAQDGVASGISYSAEDRLCLDGQRLVPISGPYGQTDTTYTTEIDSLIIVTQTGDLASSDVSFSVSLPNGNVRSYGGTQESLVVPTGVTQELSWLIDKETDVSGNNTIAYEYTPVGNGEQLLSDIYYTGNGENRGDRRVNFVYETAGHYRTSYLQGGYTRSTQRLQTINTYLGETHIREYTLNYVMSSASSRPLLDTIVECGKRGTEVCREATSMNWADDAPKYVLEVFKDGDGNEVYPAAQASDGQGGTFTRMVNPQDLSMHFDLNGDGVRDWMSVNDNSEMTFIHVNAEGDLRQSNTQSPLLDVPRPCDSNIRTSAKSCVIADYNVDGITDFKKKGSDGNLWLGFWDGSTINWEPTGIDMDGGEDVTVLGASDFNGDGYPDLLVEFATCALGSCGSADIRLYLNTPNSDATLHNRFTSTYTLLFEMESDTQSEPFRRTAQSVGDINGDGLPDLAVIRSFDNTTANSIAGFLLSEVDSSSSVSMEFVSQLLPITLDSINSLVDVNGDGLPDWIGVVGTYSASANWSMRLNQGNGNFGTAIELVDINFDSRVVQKPSGQEFDIETELAFKHAIQVMDLNGDGKSEILIPSRNHIEVQGCSVVDNAENAVRCGSDLSGNYTDVNSGSLIPIPSEKDINIYKYRAVFVDEDENGTFTAREEDSGIYGSINGVLATDTYGKGLTDMVFTFGCREAETTCYLDDTVTVPSPFNGNFNKVFINRNYGATSKASPGAADYVPVDVLTSIDNGVGLTSSWEYSPLSSDEYTNLYDPARESFADGEHFNFASSMYVVASFAQSNGVGGSNETRYQYTGAVYNNQGRGFRGFKSITQLNMANGTASHTRFLQKFPYSSLVENQSTFSTNVATTDWTCAIPAAQNDDVAMKAAAATNCKVISYSENDWQNNSNHNIANSYLLYNANAHSVSYDLSDHDWVSYSHTTTALSDVDQFGNVEKQTSSVEDAFGTYSSTKLADYSQATREWPWRYESKTVVKHKVSPPPEGFSVTVSTDNDKVVKTDVTWNSDVRKPETVTVKHGETSGTGDANTATNTTTVTTTKYNDYGLPTSVDVTGNVCLGSGACSSSQTRRVLTDYTNSNTQADADGYFPFTISQLVETLNGLDAIETAPVDDRYLVTTTKTDGATGLPTEVSDVSGVVTVTTYDALARPTRIERTGTTDQLIRYYSASSPSNAIMRVTTKQAGVPESREYKDVLGRTVRTAIRNFDDTGFINQDVVYNSLGQVAKESNPYASAAFYTVYDDPDKTEDGYDKLGRAKQKVSQQTNGTLTTSYTYDGLQTNINVAASVASEGASTLAMSRTYNALQQLVQTVDANDGVTQYAYDGSGNPIVIEDAAGNQITARYDALGRKVYVNDPNQGQTNFTYNDFGELEKEQDANGEWIYYDMDLLGRVTDRSGDNGATASFDWDTNKAGLLTSQSVSGHSTTYTYDSAARVEDTTVTIEGTPYTTSNTYDDAGRPVLLQYPEVDGNAGVAIEYVYNTSGYLTTERNASSKHVYRNVTSQDAFGNITDATINAGGLTGEYSYSSKTGQMLHSKVGADIHYLDYSNYDSYGNLLQVHNRAAVLNGAETVDTYVYDTLHRLTSSTYSYAGTPKTIAYDYDIVGNFDKKTDYSADEVGAYSYYPSSNKLQSVELVGGGTESFTYDSKGNQTHRNGTLEVVYNVFNKPVQINRNGSNIDLAYGADLMRYKQVRTETSGNATTYYIGKHFEVEVSGTSTKYQHYISDVAILNLYSNRTPDIVYTHKDRLGSTATMTDHNNNVVARRYFDPFGKPRMGATWSLLQDLNFAPTLNNNLEDGLMATRRGFTDHEHLDQAELIHMNGRVYDYNLGRFLSVDPVIQFVGNSQGINPYSYIMNNPMAGTDPTGYVIDTIWDVGNVIFDVGKVAYGAITGDSDMVSEGLTDLAVDAAATMVPFVPAGASKAARAGAEKVADARQASKKSDTTPTTQKSESSSNTDSSSKGNGAESSQSASGSKTESTTEIGSQESINKQGTSGGDRAGKPFTKKGKQTVIQRNKDQNGGVTKCESCGVETVPAQKSQKGVTPPKNETQVDHIQPKSKGGDGSPSNGQVLCRSCNREKSDKVPEPKKPDEL